MQNTVYSCNTTQQGTSGSIFASFPGLWIDAVSCCAPTAIYYDPTELVEAYRLLLQAGQEAGAGLTSQATYQHDLVMLASQCISNLGLELYQNATAAALKNDSVGSFHSCRCGAQVFDFSKASFTPLISVFISNMTVFLEMMKDLDLLMGTQPLYLFGSWIANATRWAVTNNTANGTCDTEVYRYDCGGNQF